MSAVVTMTGTRDVAVNALSRADFEDFLYHEAALLDAWMLEEWLALFTEDATYEVPTAGAPDGADPQTSLFYIADDYARLRHRITRLNSPEAHSEFPRSHVMRVISNVRILTADDDTARIGCGFVTYRSKNDVTDVFPGHHRYTLRRTDAGLRIASKRSYLDLTNLRPQGRVSIIL